MKVMTWNLWWRFGPWEQREVAITEAIRSLAPDVLFVQEAWATDDVRQVDLLAQVLGFPHAAYASRHAHEGVSIGNGIVSRWPVSNIDHLDLSTPSGLEPRVAVIAQVDRPGGSFTGCSVHLSPNIERPDARRAELRSLLSSLVERECEQVLIGGDFNAELSDPEIQETLTETMPKLQDVWGSCSTNVGLTVSKDNPYLRNDDPLASRRIDFLLSAGIDASDVAVVATEPVNGIYPSDHYAVCASFDD